MNYTTIGWVYQFYSRYRNLVGNLLLKSLSLFHWFFVSFASYFFIDYFVIGLLILLISITSVQTSLLVSGLL